MVLGAKAPENCAAPFKIRNKSHLKPHFASAYRKKEGMAAVWEMYTEMPPVTRTCLSACLLTTLAVHLELVTPLHLYFNWSLIVWRLLTAFSFFGTFNIGFVFNMVFLYHYFEMLEEGSFYGRRGDFVFLLLLGGICVALTMILVYVWCRRHQYVRMNFFGVVTFRAPYLPWVMLLFSVAFSNNAEDDYLGIIFGHTYFVLEDVFPRREHGFRLLQTPQWLKTLCGDPPEDDEMTEGRQLQLELLRDLDALNGFRDEDESDEDDHDDEDNIE